MKAAQKGFDRRQELKRYWIWLIIGISFVVCMEWNRVETSRLFGKTGMANAAEILSGFLQPDLSKDFLIRIGELSLESLYVGLLGTVFAVVLGTALALVAIRLPDLPDPPGRAHFVARTLGNSTRWLARFLLGFFRSVPEVVWAYLFVRMLGLGPGAAVLAIALTVGGSIGKLYSELGEATDRQIIGGLRASGAGRWAVILFGIIPQVSRQWVAYALFRMECNIRTGTILGVVGAGGLGSEIALSIRYFQFDKLATALLAVLAFVIALEVVSSWLRQRPMRWALGFAVVGGAVSFWMLDIPWIDLFTNPQMLPDAGAITLSQGFLANTFLLTLETLSMAWIATILAALFAFALAPMATRHLTVSSYLKNSYEKAGLARIGSQMVLWISRFTLQVSRAMPELTLALIFVVWVGPGAFAGILAIAFHNIGVVGRLYTDVYEEVEPGPARALQTAGAGPLAVWLYAVLPQVVPRLMAFTLYRFEVNVRATAMVGFVGAGGIGDALHTAISLFQIADLFVLLAVMVAVVTGVDYVGDKIRHRILTGKSHRTGRSFFRRWLPEENQTSITEAIPGAESHPDLYYRIGGRQERHGLQLLDWTSSYIETKCVRYCPCALVVDVYVRDQSTYQKAVAKVLNSTAVCKDQADTMRLLLISPSLQFLAALKSHAEAAEIRIPDAARQATAPNDIRLSPITTIRPPATVDNT